MTYKLNNHKILYILQSDPSTASDGVAMVIAFISYSVLLFLLGAVILGGAK